MRQNRNTLTSVGGVDAAAVFDVLGLPYLPHTWDLRDLAALNVQRNAGFSPGPWHSQYILVFESLAQARQALPLLTSEGVAKDITMLVEINDDVRQACVAGTPDLIVSQSLSVRTITGQRNYRVTQISSSTWTNIHSFASRLAGYFSNDLRRLPYQGRRLGIQDFESASWSVGDSLARWVDPLEEQGDVPAVDSVDLVVGPGKGATAERSAKEFSTAWCELPPIDPMIFSPRGFDPFPRNGEAALCLSEESRWTLQYRGNSVRRPFSCLDENVLDILRSFQRLDVSSILSGPTQPVARLLTQLAAAGVPLKTGPIEGEVRDRLGTEFSNTLQDSGGSLVTPSLRESDSIHVRRAALKKFLPMQRLRGLGIAEGKENHGAVWPSVSIVLATRRPSLIPQILHQISRQTYSNLETVVAIHGQSQLPSDARYAIENFPGRIRVHSYDEKVVFGEVLNKVCAMAEGQLLTKMDDDDWYSPFHVEDLVLARQYSGAQMVGAPVEFTYLGGIDLTTRRNHGGERYTNHVAGGTIMISKGDLLSVGGWRPISNAVDRGLIDVILATGGKIYRTHGQNYVMHRRSPASSSLFHTWNANHSVFLRDVIEQWDGRVLPPQFVEESELPITRERGQQYRSVFSR